MRQSSQTIWQEVNPLFQLYPSLKTRNRTTSYSPSLHGAWLRAGIQLQCLTSHQPACKRTMLSALVCFTQINYPFEALKDLLKGCSLCISIMQGCLASWSASLQGWICLSVASKILQQAADREPLRMPSGVIHHSNTNYHLVIFDAKCILYACFSSEVEMMCAHNLATAGAEASWVSG